MQNADANANANALNVISNALSKGMGIVMEHKSPRNQTPLLDIARSG